MFNDLVVLDVRFFHFFSFFGVCPLSFTGPSVDHTTDTPLGFYLYIEASLMKADDKAILLSEFYPPTQKGTRADGIFPFFLGFYPYQLFFPV